MSRNICLDAPVLGSLEKEYLAKAIDSGYVSTIGPYVSKFEDDFSRFVGTKKAVSVQSGTSAIRASLHELGIGPGDEVIVPALTFIATVNPVVYVGAKPVFADVESKTWNIDPRDIERKITKKTRAVIPVHLYGNPCDMNAITKVAKKHGIFVIEDAAESLGARYKGKYTGTFGDFGCFSFNGNKVITTGGGGMVVGNDIKRLEHIKFLVNQARDEDKGYYHPEIGFNDRMTNIEAALGLAQMKRLKGFLKKKRIFNKIYTDGLRDVNCVHFQEAHDDAASSHWLTCVIFDDGINLPVLQKKLKEKGIHTRRVFMPITEFPPYAGFKRGNYEVSYDIYERGLCLPSSILNSEDDIYFACKTIRKLVE